MAGTDGLLVTNAHVVKGAAAIQVVFADGTYYAVIAAMDEDKDLAVLRVPARFPEPLRLGDSDELREGDDVALTGYPLALELLRNGIPLYASTAKATVNAVRPGRSLVHQQSMLYIQIDAPINPGNSGAPLYRLDSGVVVGVVQSKLAYEYVQDTGVGFAIPINAVRRLLAEARANTIPRRRHHPFRSRPRTCPWSCRRLWRRGIPRAVPRVPRRNHRSPGPSISCASRRCPPSPNRRGCPA